jgi:cob(I)alamin adenosyltransferase
MVLRMKIYTRKGDGGETGIWGGRRLSKDDARVEAIGSVDECNAALGLALAQAEGGPRGLPPGGLLPGRVTAALSAVQDRLFVVGCELMAPERTGAGGSLPRLADNDITELEAAIDQLDSELPKLQNFIHPGGTLGAAHLHAARAACRRAERRAVSLARCDEVAPVVLIYLNRLADLLFVAARYANHQAGIPDAVWGPRRHR